MKAANDREAAGESVLHMEVGEPGAGPPRKVLDAAAEALRSSKLGYTEALGIPDLRAAIAKHYRDRYDLAVPVERVVVTTGSSGGFMLALLAAFDAGDRVAVGVPYYPAYSNMLVALGIEPVYVVTGPQTRFQPTPETLAAAGPLDGVLVASPANPTGTMLSAKAMAALVDYCATADIRLLSDEIYHGITYGEQPSSALAYSGDAIVFNGFSKYFCMTGWRLGWMVAPHDMLAAIERLAQNLFISAPNVSQKSAVAAFDCREELEANVAAYARNRDLLLRELPKAGIGNFAPADGAFYIYANVSNLTNDSPEFCRRMLSETGVAVTPGIDFDAQRGSATIRISFAGSEADTAQAAARLIDWLG